MRIEFHEVIDSTQRRARALAEANDRRWDAVCAAHQTAGRGRQGTAWHDQPHQSLLTTLILWDTPLPQPVGLLGTLAALATAHALEAHYPALPPIRLKYPNDLMLMERKLSGVLAEVVSSTALVGIGVNIAQRTFPPELADRAISVAMALSERDSAPCAPCVSREECTALVRTIHASLMEYLTLWRVQPEAVYTHWQARDCSVGRAYRILDLPDQPVGIATGVAPDFRLSVLCPDGTRSITYHVSAL